MATLSTSFGGGASSGFGPSAPGTQFKDSGLYVQYSWGGSSRSGGTTSAPQATPVSPTFDPKIEANALYGKPMSLMAGGFARIGASPAPIVGPYINSGRVDFAVSLGLAVPVTGNRKVYAIYLDNEKWWSSVTGWDGSGALPGDSTFHAEVADIAFRPGTLTQAVLSLETAKFPGDENAYRPQMLLEIRNLTYSRFMANTGKPVPYVACDIGDVTDGADPDDGISVGLGWERLAYSPWANYTSSTAEEVSVTDLTDAYLLKDNFTVVGLGQTVTRTHRNLDLLQSDKLRIKDRGSNVTPDIVFDRDSIIGDENPIQIIRAGATSQRRELELLAIDPDQDYTAVPSLAKIPRDPFVISAAVGKETITSPLVLDADTRQALVTYAQQYEENARKKITFKVRAIGYEVEPGDLVALVDVADGIDNEVWKVTQTLHGANFIVEIEAEAILRCSIYQAADPHFGSVVLLLHCNGAAASTSFVDSSSFVNTMTANGNAQISATSKYGSGALICDGTADGVTTGFGTPLLDTGLSVTNTSPYTIECWARFTSINRTQVLVAQDTGLLGQFFRLRQNGDDELQFSWSETGGSFTDHLATTAANITTGVYIFVVVDKDSTGKLRIYVDGVMKASDTPANNKIGDSADPISVGSNGLLSGASFDGLIDEVRITRGISRYGDVYGDVSFSPPSDEFPGF